MTKPPALPLKKGPTMRLHFIHNWTPWKDNNITETRTSLFTGSRTPYSYDAQIRRCLKCNKLDIR